jgi:hypothetical protein
MVYLYLLMVVWVVLQVFWPANPSASWWSSCGQWRLLSLAHYYWLPITDFLDFVHRPRILHTGLAFSKGANRVGVSLPVPEDGNRSSFRNVVLSSIQNSGRWTTSRNAACLSCFWHASTSIRGRLFMSAWIRDGSRFKRFSKKLSRNPRAYSYSRLRPMI